MLEATLPELPEVHTTATKLNGLISGLTISDTWTDYYSPLYEGKQQIKNKKYFDQFKKDVAGVKVLNVTRRAKNVLINLENNKTILVHMKMTGHLLFGTYKKNDKFPANNHLRLKSMAGRQISNSKLKESWQKETWVPNEKEDSPLWDSYNRFIHLVFSFSNNKHLILSDVRKFAKIVVEDTDRLFKSEHLGKLGPEPLEKDFTFQIFKERLSKRINWPTKLALMNQELIAGIGNIYSDEMLWRAGIHPLEKVESITPKKLTLLFTALKETLAKGIDLGGDSTSDYRQPNGERGEFQERHLAYQRKNVECLKRGCNGIMKRILAGSRSAHFCEKHQKLNI